MGQSTSQSIGDIFYPSNARLRARCDQLAGDIEGMKEDFDRRKKEYDAMDKRLREQTSKFLKSHGYDSVDDLDKTITEAVEGKVLDDWEELKSQFDRAYAIEEAILSIAGVAVTTGAAVSGSLVLVGIISGPVGWAALGAITTAFALIGLGVGIGSIIAAAKQQKELRKAVVKLFRCRQDARVQLNRLDLLIEWTRQFDMYMRISGETTLDKYDTTPLWENLKKADMFRWNEETAVKDLKEYDKMRNANTEFDPEPIIEHDSIKIPDKLPYMGPNPKLVTEKMRKRVGSTRKSLL